MNQHNASTMPRRLRRTALYRLHGSSPRPGRSIRLLAMRVPCGRRGETLRLNLVKIFPCCRRLWQARVSASASGTCARILIDIFCQFLGHKETTSTTRGVRNGSRNWKYISRLAAGDAMPRNSANSNSTPATPQKLRTQTNRRAETLSLLSLGPAIQINYIELVNGHPNRWHVPCSFSNWDLIRYINMYVVLHEFGRVTFSFDLNPI